VESWQPQAMSDTARNKARDTAAAVTGALGWAGHCSGVELFIKGDEVWFSEVSPRPHDTGLVHSGVANSCRNSPCMPAPFWACLLNTEMASPGASGGDLWRVEAGALAFEGRGRGAENSRQRIAPVRQAGNPSSSAAWAWRLARGTTTDEARIRAKRMASMVKPPYLPVTITSQKSSAGGRPINCPQTCRP